MSQQPKTYSDTDRLDKLDELLRTRPEMIEFWFDPSLGCYWAGDHVGENVRMALDGLLEFERQYPGPRKAK